MKQAIEIEVPEGYKAVYDKDTQEVEIVKVELPKTWRDFCENYPIKNRECFITERSKIGDFHTEDWGATVKERRARNIDVDKNVFSDRETAEAFLALMQLIRLRDCYRQGWKPDWKNNEDKFVIEIIDGEITTYWDNRRSRILSFQSEKICEDFLKNFRDLIEKAKELI